MQKGKGKATSKRDDLPDAFQSIAEAGAFWDSHDSADYAIKILFLLTLFFLYYFISFTG